MHQQLSNLFSDNVLFGCSETWQTYLQQGIYSISRYQSCQLAQFSRNLARLFYMLIQSNFVGQTESTSGFISSTSIRVLFHVHSLDFMYYIDLDQKFMRIGWVIFKSLSRLGNTSSCYCRLQARYYLLVMYFFIFHFQLYIQHGFDDLNIVYTCAIRSRNI